MVKKSRDQLRYEQEMVERRRQFSARGIAHPAVPLGKGELWRIACERPGCSETFVTGAKQRRFCSAACRRNVEAVVKKRLEWWERREQTCAAPNCAETFLPVQAAHRFCSSKCQQRAYRAAGKLNGTQCAHCGVDMQGRTARAKYCSPRCQVAASRQRRKEVH